MTEESTLTEAESVFDGLLSKVTLAKVPSAPRVLADVYCEVRFNRAPRFEFMLTPLSEDPLAAALRPDVFTSLRLRGERVEREQADKLGGHDLYRVIVDGRRRPVCTQVIAAEWVIDALAWLIETEFNGPATSQLDMLRRSGCHSRSSKP